MIRCRSMFKRMPTTYLISFLTQHTVISIISNCEYMRWKYWSYTLILVQSHVFWIVDGIEFKWIDSNQNAANIGINVAGHKSLL